MSSNIRHKTILGMAGITVFAAVLCVGCYDLGLEPSITASTVETFVDPHDGHVYKKVKIGNQTWMAENLNFAADGRVCHRYGCETYGRQYDWNTAMDNVPSSIAKPSGVEGVCPVGWHLPSDAEWSELTDYIGEHAGTKLKSKTFSGTDGAPYGTDLYGFSALGGYHNPAIWWTATEYEGNENWGWIRNVGESYDWVGRVHQDKHYYFYSVRCVHD